MSILKSSPRRYGIVFAALALGLIYNAIYFGGWAWLLLWPAVSFAMVALAYLRLGPRVMGKSPLGDFSWWSHVALLPFRLFVLGGWYLGRLIQPGKSGHEIVPGLWLGRRVSLAELPPDTRLVIDLTSEMSCPRGIRGDGVRRYVCVPALDRGVPDDTAARAAIDAADQVARDGGIVYIHCAQGFGRSASLVAAILVRRGEASDVDDAVAKLQSLRPGVKLNAEQRAFVTRLTRDSRPISPSEAVRRVVEWLRTQPRDPTIFIALDGPGGAGKSTLAATIAREITDRNVVIVHTDDFYLPSDVRPPVSLHGIDIDLRRLQEEVLDPLASGRPAHYQRYDWPTDALADWHDLPPSGVLLLEGVGAAAIEIRDRLDLILWVDAPPDVRLARGLLRDGEQARPLWVDKWLPAEERYVAAHRADAAAHFRVDGLLPYDPPV
jgi:uridine kinase/protein-tyrosine phosphatase